MEKGGEALRPSKDSYLCSKRCLEETNRMCELKVLRKNKIVFKDVVYAKADGNRVTVKDVLGASKSFDNCIIAEVDIRSERLLLMPVKEQ